MIPSQLFFSKSVGCCNQVLLDAHTLHLDFLPRSHGCDLGESVSVPASMEASTMQWAPASYAQRSQFASGVCCSWDSVSLGGMPVASACRSKGNLIEDAQSPRAEIPFLNVEFFLSLLFYIVQPLSISLLSTRGTELRLGHCFATLFSTQRQQL